MNGGWAERKNPGFQTIAWNITSSQLQLDRMLAYSTEGMERVGGGGSSAADCHNTISGEIG